MSVNEAATVLAIDVGVTNVKAGLVDRYGRISHYSAREAPIEKGAGGVSEVLVRVCRDVLGEAGLTTKDLAAVGCCTPGCVNPETGVIVASATPGWVGIDVKEPLQASFERPVTVEGDGVAAALSVHAFGPTRGHDNLLAITVGTGISCGYILDGKIVRGAGQAALEAGHMPLFFQGRPCSCGRRGCWEAHAGGGALRTLLREYQAAGHQLPDLPEELAELGLASHETARTIWEEQGMLFGLGIAVLLNVLNPKTVVLGGGVMRSWSLFHKSLLKTAREKALPRNAEAAIVCANDPDRIPLLGAAVAAIAAQGPADFFENSQANSNR
ncbi:MAG TPA: ROK family protein [Myxococcota bacterium]|nr:ROK family protein [Myxococcota bacterium]